MRNFRQSWWMENIKGDSSANRWNREYYQKKIAETPDLKPWNTSECLTVEYHKKKGVFNLNDSLRTIDDICAVFDTMPKHRGYLRMGATPVPGHENLDIWYPIKENNKGWKNEREDHDDTIIEYHEDEDKRKNM